MENKDEARVVFFRKDERPQVLEELKRKVHLELIERVGENKAEFNQTDEEKFRQAAIRCINNIFDEMSDEFSQDTNRGILLKEILDEALGLGPIEDLIKDPGITEIMVNGKDKIYIERNGRLELTNKKFISDRQIMNVIERIIAPLGRRIDESSPMVDARLKDGSRVNAIIPPLSLAGPVLTIRKFSHELLTVKDLTGHNSVNTEMAEFLKLCVINRFNIIISGGTGSGKTTLLNILSNFIPLNERIITIEDSAELDLLQEHVVSLEGRPRNIEGRGEVNIRDLVRNSLRMRPDRIIVGEVRSGEAIDMLQAMNTGHDGSLSTIHANSPRDVLSRLETMVLMSGMELPVKAIREQIASAIDLIVHQQRFQDGTRKIINITEITGIENDRIMMQEIFSFKQSGFEDGKVKGDFAATGNIPRLVEKLRARGVPVPLELFESK